MPSVLFLALTCFASSLSLCQFAEKWFEFEGSYGMTRIARAKRAISKAASFTAEKLHLTSSHKGDRKSQAKKKGVKAEV